MSAMRFHQRHLLVLLLLATLFACGSEGKTEQPPSSSRKAPRRQTATVVFPDGFSVRAPLAVTPTEQARGLMFVHKLPLDKGMLFLFKMSARQSFWMKNCFISLDMIWLDEDFNVVDISENVPPCRGEPCPTYRPSRPIRNVLEVNGGVALAHGLKVGDHLVVIGLPALQRSPP